MYMNRSFLSILLFTLIILNSSAQNIDSTIFSDIENTNWKRRFYNTADSLEHISDSIRELRQSNLEKHVLSLKNNYSSLNELSRDLLKPAINDSEKIWLIFRWITNNIAYDCEEYHKTDLTYKQEVFYDPRHNHFKNIDSLNGVNTFKKRKGVCEDYADLFKTLCDINHLTCEKIDGYTEKGKDVSRKSKENLSSNHAWNIVQIHTLWYMIDATWASGYADQNVTVFTKHFQPDYYLTPINEGYPDHCANKSRLKKLGL